MLYLSSAAVEVAERSPFSGTLGTILGTVIAAIITGAAMYLVAKVGRRTGKESGDWQRIEGLWGRVDKLEEEVVQLPLGVLADRLVRIDEAGRAVEPGIPAADGVTGDAERTVVE